MAIMSLLAAVPELSFTEMRDTLKMTDGNLSMHIRTLQESGYVAVTKTFRDKKPLTSYSLTPPGREAFSKYISLLEEIVKQNRK